MELSPGVNKPLCGWEFYLKHKNDVIPFEFESISNGIKHTVKLNSDKHAKQVINSIYKSKERR